MKQFYTALIINKKAAFIYWTKNSLEIDLKTFIDPTSYLGKN